MEEKSSKKVVPRNLKYQYFSAIAANLLVLGCGAGVGWLSVALPLLQSNDSPLESGPMTTDELSWTGSIISIGGITGNLFFGFLINKIGSKNSLLLLGIPQTCSWLFLIFGRQVLYLYASRFATGFVIGGNQICISLYVAEIADNDVRGRLGTVYQFNRNFGILFAFTIGSYFSYITASMCFIGITAFYYGIFLFMPSTPQFLLQKNQIQDAEKSFQFYKGYKNRKESVSCFNQFDNLKNVAKKIEEDSKLNFRDLWNARKGFALAILYSIAGGMTASFIFLTYGIKVIEMSGTHLSPKLSSISLAAVQLIGTFLTSQLVDSKGRTFLLVISMAGSTLGLAVMATYSYLHTNGIDTSMFHWTPVLCMAFIVFISAIGIIPLTLICIVESFPLKVRSFGLTFGNLALNGLGFVFIKMFPILLEILGLVKCLAIFSMGCVICTFLMIVFVEETNGKELNEVEKGVDNPTK